MLIFYKYLNTHGPFILFQFGQGNDEILKSEIVDDGSLVRKIIFSTFFMIGELSDNIGWSTLFIRENHVK